MASSATNISWSSRDNEKTIPTILTTSQKLSTGVDARNVRNIVLMRPIKSMIEFKQIIGRGTRLYEGKDYFTIYDFVKAYEHFNDPEWDGEPMGPEAPPEPRPRPDGAEEPETPPYDGEDDEDAPRPGKIRIKLADGKERIIQHMTATTFWSADGRPMSAAQFVESLFGELPHLFKDEDELRRLWSEPDTRKALLHGLSEKGFGGEQLAEIGSTISAEKSDMFDVLAYVAFALPPITRRERADASQTRSPRITTTSSRIFSISSCRNMSARASRNWIRKNSARWSTSNTVPPTKPRPPWAACVRSAIHSSGFRGICTRA